METFEDAVGEITHIGDTVAWAGSGYVQIAKVVKIGKRIGVTTGGYGYIHYTKNTKLVKTFSQEKGQDGCYYNNYTQEEFIQRCQAAARRYCEMVED